MPKPWRVEPMENDTSDVVEADYVIVGAGSAGCLLANRLSKDHDVVLLEAGGNDDWIWIHIPVGYLYCIGNERTDWCYRTTADPGLNGRSLGYPRGRVLGGSSSINGMLYLRGQKADYDGWAAHGNPGWSWSEVLPLFVAVEKYYGAPSKFHGCDGNWRVERQRLHWDILDAFRDAAVQAGIPEVSDFNRGDNFGCGYFEVNQRRGVRWSAAQAFLRPVEHRSSLRVIPHALATKLQLKDRVATGVLFLRDGREMVARARKEVILAAGSIGSPQLLQVSGIGDAAHLQSIGIPVVADLPGVGANLQDHLQLRMIFKVQHARTLNTLANSMIGKAWMGLRYAITRSGPLAMAPSQFGLFAKSDPSQPRANIEFHVQPLSLDKFGDPLHRFPAITAAPCNLQPTSRGYVRVTSPDVTRHPEINCRYLSTGEDRKVAADGLRLARRILSQPALKPYQPVEFLPGAQVTAEAEIEHAAGDIGTTIFHPVGTCKMGVDHASVVDATLRVHGIDRLRVVDASIMPVITSGNTNSPTIMIAEKGSRMILAGTPAPTYRSSASGSSATITGSPRAQYASDA